MNSTHLYSIKIKGVTPLITHSDKACNPLHPITKRIKEITSIRKKTDEHHLALMRIEFEAAMYFDEDMGVYMPSKCLHGCIKAAAKKFKLGKQTKAITIENPLGYPLLPYKGKNPESLYNETNKSGERTHVFIESLVVSNARVMRTRPIFHTWEVEFKLFLDKELMKESDLKMILETAGYEYGLCELRPGRATGSYGKFEVIEFKQV